MMAKTSPATHRGFESVVCCDLLTATLSKVVIVGVGGAGNNLVNKLMETGATRAECVAVNTDRRHLDAIHAHQKLLVGTEVAQGIGACGDPEIGRKAVEESLEKLAPVFWNMDAAFIVAGMGGGTGTGAAPLIAKMAQESGAVVTGILTMPFENEKRERMFALQGLESMSRTCHTTVVVDNNRPIEAMPGLVSDSALPMADDILVSVLKGLSDTLSTPSYVRTDVSDVKNVLRNGGIALAGIGESNSMFRVEEAVRNALQSPFLEVDHKMATGALVFVTGDSSMSNSEAARVAEVVEEILPTQASVTWGARVDPSMDSRLRVTLVLTGMDYWQQYVGGYRKMPFGIYNMEPEVGKDQNLDIELDLDQLESD
jgi:cell division protein FtsZ